MQIKVDVNAHFYSIQSKQEHEHQQWETTWTSFISNKLKRYVWQMSVRYETIKLYDQSIQV